jgi:4-aminobutyrate--pyruvate transaminase
MTDLASNSNHARDIAHFIHLQTNLVRHGQERPIVIVRGEGVHVYDEPAKNIWKARPGCGVRGHR